MIMDTRAELQYSYELENDKKEVMDTFSREMVVYLMFLEICL